MKERKCFIVSAASLIAFTLWTVLIMNVDVQAVGPRNSKVGLATFNTWFHQLTGVHMTLYTITDWLGLVPIAVCLCFGCLGIYQLIKRRRLLKVDPDILLLGVYYILVIVGYLIFEMIPINYRPVLIDGFLEASYLHRRRCWCCPSCRPLFFKSNADATTKTAGRLSSSSPLFSRSSWLSEGWFRGFIGRRISSDRFC